jgi:hypothetical protein
MRSREDTNRDGIRGHNDGEREPDGAAERDDAVEPYDVAERGSVHHRDVTDHPRNWHSPRQCSERTPTKTKLQDSTSSQKTSLLLFRIA